MQRVLQGTQKPSELLRMPQFRISPFRKRNPAILLTCGFSRMKNAGAATESFRNHDNQIDAPRRS